MHYKGFIIIARPRRRGASNTWTMDVVIVRSHGRQIRFKKFKEGGVYKTRGEALRRCFQAGQQIINGGVPGCNVDNL